MMHGRNNGKKLMAACIVKHAMEIIHLLTDLNPIQVNVDAVINRARVEVLPVAVMDWGSCKKDASYWCGLDMGAQAIPQHRNANAILVLQINTSANASLSVAFATHLQLHPLPLPLPSPVKRNHN
ncbi:hypothetical protein LOK49_LG12G00086 [Camellia lanceoleosa]|uniref:Uncharacterized protein n=1 Tax=Camellia lanceoleosa TaxID=1840588 RepID=A0ACC0FXA7_9ERIC|nr:hypothetical protein LOK49_LG12G00086 [Camellia lanceoleosa]